PKIRDVSRSVWGYAKGGPGVGVLPKAPPGAKASVPSRSARPIVFAVEVRPVDVSAVDRHRGEDARAGDEARVDRRGRPCAAGAEASGRSFSPSRQLGR